MGKTIGQRIVEGWLKPARPIFSDYGKYDDTPLSNLAELIDIEIMSCSDLVMSSAESAISAIKSEAVQLRDPTPKDYQHASRQRYADYAATQFLSEVESLFEGKFKQKYMQHPIGFYVGWCAAREVIKNGGK